MYINWFQTYNQTIRAQSPPTPQSSDRWTVIGWKILFAAIAAHCQGQMLEQSMAATDTSAVEEKISMSSPRGQWAKPSLITTWIGIPISGHQPTMAAWQRGLAPLRSDRNMGMATVSGWELSRAVESAFMSHMYHGTHTRAKQNLFDLPYLDVDSLYFMICYIVDLCWFLDCHHLSLEIWALAQSLGMWMRAIIWYSHTLPPNMYIATQPPKYVYTKVLGTYVNITWSDS